jgi:thiamine-phosphate diphosphorylase
MAFPPLHALTTDVVLSDPAFVRQATAAMHACRSRLAVHLRSSAHTAFHLLELALELRVVAEQTGSWVMITDRVDIALAAGVTGAQLTTRSLSIGDARRIAPKLVLGASVHTTNDAWLTAQSGADYIVAGQQTGDGAVDPQDPVQWIAEVVAAAAPCPIVAVGGITEARAHDVARAGAAGMAVLRGLWLDDAALAARRYLAAYDEGCHR